MNSAKERNTLQIGHRDRLRTRYLKAGSEGMSDCDLLELLLTFPILRRDVKIHARRLLDRYKNISGILDADMGEICKVSGLTEKSAFLFRIVRDLCERYLHEKVIDKDVISSPDILADYARLKLGSCREEVLMTVYLDVKNHVITTDILAKGTVDSAIIYPRTIAAEALRQKASGVILVHNHPSGDVMPSQEDINFTNQIRQSLAALEIRLLDHLIIGRDAIFSFHEKHLLERVL